MSSTSPDSAFSSEGRIFPSDLPSTYGSAPTTPMHSRPVAAMAITDLVISEAHYLAAIKRVADALGQAAEISQAAGRKDSATIRTLIDRWSEMMRVHAKFHDDLIAVSEDLREAAGLINGL
ncbi:hypothetical protein BGZ58_009438, partial [Dissophora ornata]